MNIAVYKDIFNNVKKYKYEINKNRVTLYSSTHGWLFRKYVDVLGRKSDDLFVKHISINNKNILEMYYLYLYLKVDDNEQAVDIKGDKIFIAVVVHGIDKDKEQDYMMQAGFTKSDTQWDKYGLHWNFYYVSYEELCAGFSDIHLYTLKTDEFTKEKTKEEITMDKAVELFEKRYY